MRLLLDTHAIIWHIEQNPALGTTASTAIKDVNNHIHVSTVSLWELSIKVSLGKLKLPDTIKNIAKELRESGVTFIPVSEEHAMATESLPWHHRDPFDRMLIAQAQIEKLTLVSRDSFFGSYDISRIW